MYAIYYYYYYYSAVRGLVVVVVVCSDRLLPWFHVSHGPMSPIFPRAAYSSDMACSLKDLEMGFFSTARGAHPYHNAFVF